MTTTPQFAIINFEGGGGGVFIAAPILEREMPGFSMQLIPMQKLLGVKAGQGPWGGGTFGGGIAAAIAMLLPRARLWCIRAVRFRLIGKVGNRRHWEGAGGYF